jgi:hypothetical protein
MDVFFHERILLFLFDIISCFFSSPPLFFLFIALFPLLWGLNDTTSGVK